MSWREETKERSEAIERQDRSTAELVELRLERDDLRSLVRFYEQTLENVRIAVEERQVRDAVAAHLLRDVLSALKLTVGLLAEEPRPDRSREEARAEAR